MATYSKLGHGKYGNIDEAISNGTLNGKDIVITSDTSELIYINNDGTKQIVRGKVLLFDSEESAITAINKLTDTYAGQYISIKDSNGKYAPYTIQEDVDGFTVKPVVTRWQEF